MTTPTDQASKTLPAEQNSGPAYDGTIVYPDEPLIFWRENPHSGAIETWIDDEPSRQTSWDSRAEMLEFVESRAGSVMHRAHAQNSGHTQGPWEATMETECGAHVSRVLTGSIIADAYGRSEAETSANARLIATAPELLSALEAVDEWLERYGMGEDSHARKTARAAIAKAKGQP